MESRRWRPVTYILPTTGWAALLEIIAKDCPPGSTLQVGTEEMERLAQEHLALWQRQDVTVVLNPELLRTVRQPDRSAS